MRINNTSIAKRATLFLIAIFSCAQIMLGFFLITEKGNDIDAHKTKIIELASTTHLNQNGQGQR